MITKVIRFDEGKWAELSKIATEKGTTNAALIREAVYGFIAATKKKQKEEAGGENGAA